MVIFSEGTKTKIVKFNLKGELVLVNTYEDDDIFKGASQIIQKKLNLVLPEHKIKSKDQLVD